MRIRFKKFEIDVESKYGILNHSNDQTGAEGEDIPSTVSLCLKWLDYRNTHDNSPNAEPVRKRKRTIIENLLEPRAPLGCTSELPRSQIARENESRDTNSGFIAPTVTTDNNASASVRTVITKKKVLPILNYLQKV